jgi:hypothetical protein
MSKDSSLDEEGIPDLAGPLPAKVATGDEQEGLMPPSDRPASLDWGTTAEEQRAGEPLSIRVARELPDRLVTPRDREQRIELVEDEAPADVGELVAQAVETDLAVSPEDAALHIIDDEVPHG